MPPKSEPTLQLEHAPKPLPLMYTKTVELWLQSLTVPQKISIDLATIAPCIEVHSTFSSREISITDNIIIHLRIKYVIF